VKIDDKIRQYLILAGLTGFGSALTSIAGFLKIDDTFGAVLAVSSALAIKTLGLGVFGIFAPHLLSKTRFRKVLLYSQTAGALSLFVLLWALNSGQISFSILAIVVSGFPGVILSIVSTSLFKISNPSERSFRKIQGLAGAIAGGSFFAAGILSPLLIHNFGITAVLAIDFLTFIVMIAFLTLKPSEWIDSLPTGNPIDKNADTRETPFFDDKKLRFILGAIAAYLLIGLLPLIGSSTHSRWAEVMTFQQLGVGWLWAFESMAETLGSLIYSQITNLGVLNKFLSKTWPTGFLLIPLTLCRDNFALTALLLLCISSLTLIFFCKVRDDFILSASRNSEIINFSAFANVVEKLIMFASPLVLTPFIGIHFTGYRCGFSSPMAS